MQCSAVQGAVLSTVFPQVFFAFFSTCSHIKYERMMNTESERRGAVGGGKHAAYTLLPFILSSSSREQYVIYTVHFSFLHTFSFIVYVQL